MLPSPGSVSSFALRARVCGSPRMEPRGGSSHQALAVACRGLWVSGACLSPASYPSRGHWQDEDKAKALCEALQTGKQRPVWLWRRLRGPRALQ